MIPWITYLFGSGDAFLIGSGFLIVGLVISFLTTPRRLARLRDILIPIGILFVFLSAAPLEYWFYALWACVIVASLILDRDSRARRRRPILFLRVVALALSIGALLNELRYRSIPTIPKLDAPHLCVIGDSVSAGMGEQQVVPWPTILESQHRGLRIQNLSRVGATVGSVSKKVDQIDSDANLLVLEIGGNDLLGSTTAREFGDGLEKLLSQTARPDRVVLMFELPLPPLSNEFGRIQRKLASKYQVHLFPKRYFIRILTTAGATSDSIHLTQSGHDQMTEMIGSILEN